MYTVHVDLVLRFAPPMSDDGDGIRLTRTIELPFPPVADISVYSKDWEGIDQPIGYTLKEIAWDMDRSCFLADANLFMEGVPIAMIPREIRSLIDCGWKYGSFQDSYETEHKRGRKRKALPAIDTDDWDWEEAKQWETKSEKSRPKEFKIILQSVAATMVELRNDCHIAYAMLKTGMLVKVERTHGYLQAPPLEAKFRDAIREYETMAFEQQWDWRERALRRYPRLIDVVNALE